MPNVVYSLLVSLVSMGLAAGVAAAPYATDWVEGHHSRSRLLVGGAPGLGGKIDRYVALELAMEPGWKTYWRQPGSAGGIPPQLSWQGSVNLKRATLKYPAPLRMVDSTGAAIGYKKSVVFPIAIETELPSRPVVLDLKAFFGVCREICIPAQAAFKVTLGPGNFLQTPPQLVKALARVPARRNDIVKDKPRLKALETATVAGRNALTFDVQFPGGTAGADLFAETGDHRGLAMSKVIAKPAADTIRYQIVVRDKSLWQDLGKHGVLATIVSDAASSEIKASRP